jgi:hypothetical protein
VLDPTAGDASIVRREAEDFRRETPEETLRAIDQRLRRLQDGDLRYTSPDRGPRTTRDMLERNVVWGCSARAQVACHLARACGICAILAKSLDESWLKYENKGDGLANGHVYVEVLLNGQTRLWNPGSGVVNGYVPTEPVIEEGRRRIYDKGGPDEVVLSHHGPQWEEETKRLFPSPLDVKRK